MDDEIIVKINKKNQTTKKTNSSNKKNLNNSKNKTREKNKANKKRLRIVVSFLGIILIILILNSGLFNIKNIEVEGNNIISDDTIISLSSLELNTNIFKFNKLIVTDNIRQNAYILDDKITRKLPSTIKIEVEERTPNYIIKLGEGYAYVNNQGYILEISNEKLDLPILIGFSTELNQIKAGNRLCYEDLEKMNTVLKIYEAAKSNDLGNVITHIDISNEKDFLVVADDQGKKIHLGDCAGLNTKILYLKSLLEATEGKKGDIFLNMDLNSQNAYFRPSVD